MARYRVGLETRERILAATREVLGEEGLEGTTLKAVTERAGVGAGSFYNLFDSKEQAVLEVVGEAIRAVDPDPRGLGQETVTDLVSAYVRFITEDPRIARIYLQVAVGGGLTDTRIAARVLRSHRTRVDRLAAAIARERPDLPRPEDHAERLLGALTGLAVTSLLDPGFPFADHVGRLQREVIGPGSSLKTP